MSIRIQKKDMISLQKKYPKPYVPVLATDGEYWAVVYRRKWYDVYNPAYSSMDWTLANTQPGALADFNLNDITHWMPLPKRRIKK